MLNQIAKNIKVLCDNKTSEQAVLNVLHAKLAHLFSFKAVKFISYNNLKTAYPIAYYGLNFVPSGGVKNQLINEIDNTLLPFLRDEYTLLNKSHKGKLEEEHFIKMRGVTEKSEIKRKEVEFERHMKEIRDLKYEMSLATPAAIYANAEIIDEVKMGSLFLKITEFADFFATSITNALSTNKMLLDLLFDLYDGQLNSTDTMTKSRKDMNNITLNTMMMSDFSLILNDDRLSKAFKSFMARGFARRSFVYINKDENYFRKDLQFPDRVDKSNASNNLEEYGMRLKNIYDKIETKSTYYFSEKADEEIRLWKINCDRQVAEFYNGVDSLNDEMKILEVDLMGSAWKITKLAVIYHILQDPCCHIVSVDAIKKAIEYYKQSYACLSDLVFKKPKSDVDKLLNYMMSNANEWVSKQQIREEKFVDNRNFTTWFKEAMEYAALNAEMKGFKAVARVYGTRNNGVEYCIYDPKKYKFESRLEGTVEKGDIVCLDMSSREVSII